MPKQNGPKREKAEKNRLAVLRNQKDKKNSRYGRAA